MRSHIYILATIYVYANICLRLAVCDLLCTLMNIYTCGYRYIVYTYIHIYVYNFLFVYPHTYVFKCKHIYIYIYINKHI